jgi:hypothetical protein
VESLTLDGDTYEVVTTFKYLGVDIDQDGSAQGIGRQRLAVARGGLAALCTFIGVHRWTYIWTRLLLYDIYVRSLMTFGAATWAPKYLQRGKLAPGETVLGKLSAQHRRGLRNLANISLEVRNEVLYVATLRWPLETIIAKVVLRYYQRVTALQSSPQPPPVALVGRWSCGQETGTYTMQQGIEMARQLQSVAAIYLAWGATIRRGVADSAHLQAPALQQIWQEFLLLGLQGRTAMTPGRVTIPAGLTVEGLQEALPGSAWTPDTDHTTLQLARKPSWLQQTSVQLCLLIEVLYTDPQWIREAIITPRGRASVAGCEDWEGTNRILG